MTTVTKAYAGLKACFAGAVGVDGAAGTTLSEITRPYQGGITITGTAPTINKFHREGEQFPAASAVDAASGGIEVTYEVMDFDDATLKFYFGPAAVGGVPGTVYRGEKTFRFDSESGNSILIPRLQYVATITGALNASDPLRIAVTGTILAPKEGEMAIDTITTPTTPPGGE